jgi:chromosome segregation ATPase
LEFIFEHNDIAEKRLKELRQEYEGLQDKLYEKDQEITRINIFQKTQQQRFDEMEKQIKELTEQKEDLEKQKMTLELNLISYKEENERLRKMEEDLTGNLRKMNIERNHISDKLDSAEYKITTFTDKITHTEQINKSLTKELSRIRSKLAEAEQYSDMLTIKKDAFERTTEVQKRQLIEQIKTLSEQVTSEKDAREKWIERYESEYKSHLETTTEVMQLRTDIKDLAHRLNDALQEASLLTRERDKSESRYQQKTLSFSETLSELEKTQRDLKTKTEMYDMLELQHNEYVTRLRAEAKRMIQEHQLEVRIMQMQFEDIRSR